MHLLAPCQIGSLTVPNRVFHAPLTRGRAGADNVPGVLMADYYRQRAAAGLLIAEATMVAADGLAWPCQPGIHTAAQVAGWRLVTDSVHAAGGRIYLQIWHPGRATHPALNRGARPISATSRPLRGDTIHTPEGKLPYPEPRALRCEELPDVVALFAKAAENARSAGFDGVQVHGAHGYLLDQFLRDATNDRTDGYGGSVANRARLLFEVIDAAAAVFGAGRVGVRISPLVAFNDMADSDPVALVTHVAAECERRALGFLELRHEQHDRPAESQLARVARRHYSGALVRNGGFTRAAGEAALREGSADAIAFGVPFIANPDLPLRFLKGAPLAEADASTFYAAGEPRGYTDYPAFAG